MKRSTVITVVAAFIVCAAMAGIARAADCDRMRRVAVGIDEHGSYRLARSLATDLDRGAAIEIRASNVHLDLMGNTLGNRVDRGACLNGNQAVRYRDNRTAEAGAFWFGSASDLGNNQ